MQSIMTETFLNKCYESLLAAWRSFDFRHYDATSSSNSERAIEQSNFVSQICVLINRAVRCFWGAELNGSEIPEDLPKSLFTQKFQFFCWRIQQDLGESFGTSVNGLILMILCYCRQQVFRACSRWKRMSTNLLKMACWLEVKKEKQFVCVL